MTKKHIEPVRTRRALAIAPWMLVAGCIVASSAFAAPPDAGSVLESTRPQLRPPMPGEMPTVPQPALPAQTATPAGGEKVVFDGFRLNGVTLFPEDELLALLEEGRQRPMTLAELEALVEQLGIFYHEHGYPLAQAIIPEQEVRDGILAITLVEGHWGEISVDNQSAVSDKTIRQFVASISGDKGVIAQAPLNRQMLLLQELPGIVARTTLKPGSAPGTTDMVVTVDQKERVGGNVDWDNFGNRYTGARRLGGAIRVNSPTGIGDQFNLRAMASASGLAYGRGAWQIPLNANGTSLSLAWSDMQYELGKDFASLQATGRAQVATLMLSHALWRNISGKLNLQFGFDQKFLTDKQGATGIDNHKRLELWTFAAAGDYYDNWFGGGVTSGNLTLNQGRLGLSESALADDQGASGLGTAGTFTKASFLLNRQQILSERFSLSCTLSGQLAADNLDSVEKMALGGNQGIRAYPQGEAAADDALMANLEIHWQPGWISGLQLSTFVDGARGWINHQPLTKTNNRRDLSGMGIGVSWTPPGGFSVSATLAQRTGSAARSDIDRSSRFWLQMSQDF